MKTTGNRTQTENQQNPDGTSTMSLTDVWLADNTNHSVNLSFRNLLLARNEETEWSVRKTRFLDEDPEFSFHVHQLSTTFLSNLNWWQLNVIYEWNAVALPRLFTSHVKQLCDQLVHIKPQHPRSAWRQVSFVFTSITLGGRAKPSTTTKMLPLQWQTAFI